MEKTLPLEHAESGEPSVDWRLADTRVMTVARIQTGTVSAHPPVAIVAGNELLTKLLANHCLVNLAKIGGQHDAFTPTPMWRRTLVVSPPRERTRRSHREAVRGVTSGG